MSSSQLRFFKTLSALGLAALLLSHLNTHAATPPPPPPDPPPGPGASTVVHVHAPSATSWNGETDFWNHVSQPVVDRMVDEGMMALTGKPTVADAWRAVLPSYAPGEAIAIKANFNNAASCSYAGPEIDALMQPINAIVRGMKAIGVEESDIWVYDAIRAIPDRFVAAREFPGVRCFGARGCAPEAATFDSGDADATVAFSPPAGVSKPPTTRLTDVLIGATYLINMPILKSHGIAGVTLGFKNHFGTIQDPYGLHTYVGPGQAYSALVDIFRNPHVGAKTILTIGDGLFGTLGGCCAAPNRWGTFGDQVPNSLFFSKDPVAIDCVMADFLAAETSIPSNATAYLQLAAAKGLGTFERGDPWGAGYDAIDYVRREL